MYLSLTDEQQFLQEAATDALGRQPTIEAAREALDGAQFTELWPVAIEAGWTGLLCAEDVDGVGLGAYEAMLVLEACGRRLADARLLGHLPATALLQAAGADADLRRALACGAKRAALVDAALAASTPAVALGEDGLLRGGVRGVLDADGADVLVVVAKRPSGAEVAVLVESGGPGLGVAAQSAYDATRLLGSVVLDGVAGSILTLDAERVADGRDLQRALLAAESLGAADAALQMARDYAIDRHAFGRAIGSYQALKHKLVEMLRRVENARSLLIHAGRAWEHDRAAFGLAANAARVTAAGALDYAAPENIFIHGGVGATWEHDAQLYYRRAEVSRRLAGGVDAAALSVAGALLSANAA